MIRLPPTLLRPRSLRLLLVFTLLVTTASAQTVPSGGVSLVAGTDLALDGSFYGGSTTGGPVAVRTLVDVTGPGITRASRIEVPRPTGEAWSTALFGTSNRALASGDVVLLRFLMRAVQTTDETGSVFIQVYAEGPGPSFTKSINQQASAGPEWVEYFLPFTVNGSYASGDFRINFGFGAGDRPRTLDLAGVQVWWYGTSRTLAEMPRTAFNYDGRSADAPWRAAAAARIDQLRKADYALRAVDEHGQPIPGARVRMRLRRHAFPFGTAFPAARVGSTSPENQMFRHKLVELFNAGSTENDLKWPAWEGNWGNGFNRAQTLASLQWLQQRGFHLRGHVLVWPSERNLPNSIKALLPSRDATIPQRVRNHIQDIVTTTRPYLNEWDVLNEPYDNKDLMEIFGNPIMVDWFKTAREHHPTAGLFINDYSILSGGGLNTAHQNHYEDTIRFLLQQGAPVTGIGMQGHFGASPTGIPRVWSILERYAQAFPGLAIKITEFDVDTDDEQLQADYTRDFLTILFSHPAVQGFQVWGFWEGAHWRKQAAMYRQDWTEKPNGAAYRQLVHGTWQTDETQTADAQGFVYGRGFLGDYDVTVTAPGRAATRSLTLAHAGVDTAVVAAASSNRARLINIATRGQVGTGGNVMIAGFTLRGEGVKDVVIRGVGPRLTDFNVAGVVPDPQIQMFRVGETFSFAYNDDWSPVLIDAFGKVGAFELASDTRSSALRLSLPGGGYTVQLSGKGSGTGVGIVEVYDAATSEPIEVFNLATRGFVGAGGNVMIGGFAIRGDVPKRVLIRGIGPTLSGFGVAGALADPVCTLYEMLEVGPPRLIAENDNWGTAANAAEIVLRTAPVAFGLDPQSRDAVLLLTLPPGNYSVQLAGVNGGTGVGLIEVYDVD
jgi:endo-1,4-beta-xylanase